MSRDGFDVRPAPSAPFNPLPLLGSGSLAGGGITLPGLLDLGRFRSLLIAAQFNDPTPTTSPEYAWLQLQWWAAAQYEPFGTPQHPASWLQNLAVRNTVVPFNPAPWDGQLFKVPILGRALNIFGLADAGAGAPVIAWEVYGSAEQVDRVQYLDPQQPYPWSLQTSDAIPVGAGTTQFVTEGYAGPARSAQYMLTAIQTGGALTAIPAAEVELWTYGPNGRRSMFYRQTFGASPPVAGLAALIPIGGGQVDLPEGPYYAAVSYTNTGGANVAYTGQLVVT